MTHSEADGSEAAEGGPHRVPGRVRGRGSAPASPAPSITRPTWSDDPTWRPSPALANRSTSGAACAPRPTPLRRDDRVAPGAAGVRRGTVVRSGPSAKRVKEESSATIWCPPLGEQPAQSGACVCCGRSAVTTAVWGAAVAARQLPSSAPSRLDVTTTLITGANRARLPRSPVSPLSATFRPVAVAAPRSARGPRSDGPTATRRKAGARGAAGACLTRLDVTRRSTKLRAWSIGSFFGRAILFRHRSARSVSSLPPGRRRGSPRLSARCPTGRRCKRPCRTICQSAGSPDRLVPASALSSCR